MTEHRSRWFQLSLKSLFLLVLLVATFFAGYSLATRHAAEAVQAEREARQQAEEAARQANLRAAHHHQAEVDITTTNERLRNGTLAE